MVLGNRKIIVASTLMALPVALLMASLTTGTSPDNLRHAGFAHNPAESGVAQAGGSDIGGAEPSAASELPSGDAVQQVGLLEAFAERRANGSAAKPSPNRAPNPPSREPSVSQVPAAQGGLLSSLFSGNGRPQPTPVAAQPVKAERPPADWNGIPFHEPRVVARSTSTAPIRDPSSQPATRIIRGSQTRSIKAIPASARRGTRVILPNATTETRVIKPSAVPTPPADTTATSRLSIATTAPLSSINSSRRSDRRTVSVLAPSPADNASTSQSRDIAADAAAKSTDELIPKVSRRELPLQEETKDEPNSDSTATEKVASRQSNPAPEEAVSAKAETAAPKVAANAPSAMAPAEKATTDTNAATAGVAAAKVTAKSTLSPPTAAPQARPYTTPGDSTAAQTLPLVAIPSRPYAASTPSAAISHRAGPPATEFQPRQDIVPPSSQSQFNAISAPIGSGLLPQLPQSQSQAAKAYIAATPQSGRGTNAYAPANSIRASNDPYAESDLNQLPNPQAAVPMHTTAPVNANRDNGFDVASPESHLRDEKTRRLKPGDTAVASELPGIRVVTHGPSEILIRQTQEFEIRVENRGSIDAQGVMVRAMIPDWADVRGHNTTHGQVTPQAKSDASKDTFSVGAGERLVWTIDHLPAGASERMFIRLRAERSGSHGLDVDWTLVPQKSVTNIHVHEPQLALVIDGPPSVTYGESQTYKVRVMNPGDGIAPNVVFTLSPNSATPQTQRIGDIPAGKEAQFEVELTAQDLGDLKIHGLAAGDLELRAEQTKTIHVAAAKLEAIMNGPEVKYQNTEAVYQLQIKNNGNAMTEQVVATLQLPGGTKYLGGIADSLQRGQVIKWKIDALAPNATRDYEFRCNMASTGEQHFTFDCAGTAAAQTAVSIATRVESIADLVMTINDPVAPAPVLTEVAYEIVVHNRGSRDATDVRAIAQFSHGIEPKRLEGHSGEVLTGQVLFDPIPRIAAGEKVQLRIVAEADRAGHHRFRSEIRSGATVLVAEEATHFMDPKSERVSRSSSEQVLR